MGKKGDKMTNASVESVERIMSQLSDNQLITTKKMFGGHGLFHDQKMFGMIDSKGKCFLKADGDLAVNFKEKGAEKHSRMPYYSVSEQIIENPRELKDWVKRSIKASK